jgi:hypothetical protein
MRLVAMTGKPLNRDSLITFDVLAGPVAAIRPTRPTGLATLPHPSPANVNTWCSSWVSLRDRAKTAVSCQGLLSPCQGRLKHVEFSHTLRYQPILSVDGVSVQS